MLTSRDVERITFTPTQIRRGYDEREVDEFLERVLTTLKHYESGGSVVVPTPEPGPTTRESGWARVLRTLRGDPG
jgi:DivIVA domain-containing protein